MKASGRQDGKIAPTAVSESNSFDGTSTGVDQWAGVVCCPQVEPCISDDGTCQPCVGDRCDCSDVELSSSAVLAAGAGVTNPSLTWPAGCRSGLSTGTASDLARCVVVAVVLSSNQLLGDMPELGCPLTLGAPLPLPEVASCSEQAEVPLPYLQELRLNGNPRLAGQLPASLVKMRYLRHLNLEDTGFTYADAAELLLHCRFSPGLRCLGLPPQSCSAFNGERETWVVDITSPEARDACHTQCVAPPGSQLRVCTGVHRMYGDLACNCRDRNSGSDAVRFDRVVRAARCTYAFCHARRVSPT